MARADSAAARQAVSVRGEHSAEPEDVGDLYDRGAAGYDHYRAIWLKLAGDAAENAMLADVRPLLRPGLRVLDAGCGTGALSRLLLEIEPDLDLTLLDLSPGMLDLARDIPGDHVLGSAQALPFAPDSFDLVVSAWVIETVDDPLAAISEFLRVLRTDGRVLYTFCSLPDGFFSRAGSALLRSVVTEQFAGQFLAGPRVPFHDCGRAHLQRFSGGLVTEVSLGSCCTIEREVLPDHPLDAAAPAVSRARRRRSPARLLRRFYPSRRPASPRKDST